jgi:hypothetical protein
VTNASNAGNDWHYENDDFLGGGDEQGGAMISGIENAGGNGAGIILTVPMLGRVSGDEVPGNVMDTVNYLDKRFEREEAFKLSAYSLTPDPHLPVVYQDEFVNWVVTKYPYGAVDARTPIWFSLDNEPDLWGQTHAEAHPGKTTYAELISKSIQYALAVKQVDPGALVFGPANYGWRGFVSLQDAPDAGGRDFQEVYLRAMKEAAGKNGGRRLLDVLDVHWYPSVRVRKIRITEKDDSADVAAARVADTRSLWDASYVENSWIAKGLGGPIDLIHRLLGKIDRCYPGTKLSISEYNFGGWDDISGAIAEADCLGIFGREGVFAACMWPLGEKQPFIAAGMRMFRDFDGKGGAFGETSVRATTSDVGHTSVYASLGSDHPDEMVIVAINKTGIEVPAEMEISHAEKFGRLQMYSLTSEGTEAKLTMDTAVLDSSRISILLPGFSVNTIRLSGK